MFSIGEKVVYPMHGAGIVESIEEKKILGSVKSYYILHIPQGNLEVMVPTEGNPAGLRPISDMSILDVVKTVLSAESTPMDENWNRRNRENMDKIKTGDVDLVCEVIRNLIRVDRVKKLSTGEKKLLINARQILCSEISMVTGMTEAEAQSIIDETV